MKKNSRKGNPKTINEHFDKKYGESGSKSRNEFEQKAEAFMVAELIKESRIKAHMTQEQLGQQMMGATYAQLIDAVRTLGHSGEAHCHLE